MDASCVSQHAVKLKKLLDDIIKRDFRVASEVHFNLLLSHLNGLEENTSGLFVRAI